MKLKNFLFIITIIFTETFSSLFAETSATSSSQIYQSINTSNKTTEILHQKEEIKIPQLQGKQLSDTIYSFLKENDLAPETQDLIHSDQNNFPYNIIVTINSKSNIPTNNLLITFVQEDFLTNKELIADLITYVKNQNYKFNTIFLFSYGEINEVTKKRMIYGTDIYLNSINSSDNYTSIVINLSSQKNSIITSSEGIIAPSWLIQNQFNIFQEHNISENIPDFYLSQLYSYKFYKNRILTSFFKNDIPAIQLNFNKETPKNKIGDVLKDSIEKFSEENETIWDHHFCIINIFGNYLKLSEMTTIKIIILIVFIWLLFILLLIFINRRLKKKAWETINHIWYIVPCSFLIVFFSFILGNFLTTTFLQTNSNISNTFILLEVQLILSIIFVSIFYLFTLFYNYAFFEKSVDFLIVISCFINQSFFILIDISLFPIFMTICFLSLLALIIKNNGLHIAVFFIMILPFLPYIYSITKYADFNSLYVMLTETPLPALFISLIIYPWCLIFFRILTSIRRNTKINISLLIGIVVIISSIFIIVSGTLKSNAMEKSKNEKENIIIKQSSENLVELTFKDEIIFDDLVRTLNFSFKEQPALCNIYITSYSKSPILYSKDDFDYLTETSSIFDTTSYPPKELVFKYGAAKEPCLITIFALFPTDTEKEYKSINKVVPIGR